MHVISYRRWINVRKRERNERRVREEQNKGDSLTTRENFVHMHAKEKERQCSKKREEAEECSGRKRRRRGSKIEKRQKTIFLPMVKLSSAREIRVGEREIWEMSNIKRDIREE